MTHNYDSYMSLKLNVFGPKNTEMGNDAVLMVKLWTYKRLVQWTFYNFSILNNYFCYYVKTALQKLRQKLTLRRTISATS